MSRLKDTTFVFTSLNNGYDNNPSDPVPNYHFERTAFSVNTLKTLYDIDIVFVDWCSEEKNKYFSGLVPGIKYVYVPPLVNDYLHEGNDSKQQYYEYISKDIGSTFVETEKVALVNGDNLFPEKFIQKLSEQQFPPEIWYTATRVSIQNDVFKDREKLLHDINNNTESFKVTDVCTFCNGDFTWCYKSTYDKAGGYNYSHRHAHEDTNLTCAFERHNFKNINLKDPYFHLDHRARGSEYIFSHSVIDKDKTKSFILNHVQITKT